MEAKGEANYASFASQLSTDHKQIGDHLIAAKQGHIFASWKVKSALVSDGKQSNGFSSTQLATLDSMVQFEKEYPGGVVAYTQRARQLLASSRQGVNPYDGYTVNEPSGSVRINDQADFDKYETLGMTESGHVAFMLVAGGLGERLGYNGIKIALPVEVTTMKTYIGYYCEHILALQHAARTAQQDDSIVLPLAIMTSNDTDTLTRSLLDAHDWFGMREQITILRQGTVPALSDNEARFALKEDGTIITKPHGHGDVHMLLHQSGTAQKWLDAGVHWVAFVQDTNYLAFRSIVAAVGASLENNLIMNSLTIPRREGDAVGAICTLTRSSEGKQGDSKEYTLPPALTINVEYNEFSSLFEKGQGEPHVLTADGKDTGYSVFPGNTNTLVFRAKEFVEVLNRTNGLIGEFVNPKYANAEKTVFQKPTRLECMMQEFPKSFSEEQAKYVSFTQFEGWASFSPVKNETSAAAAKQKGGNDPACAASGEADYFYWNRRVLREAGVSFTTSGDDRKEQEQDNESTRSFLGVTVAVGARVVLSPYCGSTQQEVRGCFPGGSQVSITDRSTLVVDTDASSRVAFDQLTLDGALEIVARNGAEVHVNNFSVSNAGYALVDLDLEDSKEPESLRIRGYKVDKSSGACVQVRFDKPGKFVLSNDTCVSHTSHL